jgi:two-component system, NtrC family, response regulator AtoC
MPEPIRVMVVDDDPAMCEFLIDFLGRRGYGAEPVQNAEQAVERFERSPPAAVILDLVMPGEMDGLAALAAFRRIDRTVPVLVLSGQGRTATVVQAMKLGAIDFVSKPFEESDLEAPLLGALRQHQLCREVAHLREQLQEEARHTLLHGRSERMVRIGELIDRIADTDIPVLICGESGTGKELVARALYAKSRRCTRPFVKVNCMGLPADVLESELFGFERGAFTGAMQHRPGKFEFANHGTLFLDELGAMAPSLQAKLLHVLQDGEFSRLGGRTNVHVDVRVIAATNQNLDAAVAAGQFREDLFLRLNEVTIALPPLRERREEIPGLTDLFIKKYSVQYNRPLIEITPPTLQALVNHDWPGNVRELENLAKRVVVLGTESTVLRDLQQAAVAARHRPVTPPSVQPEPAIAVAAPVREASHSPTAMVAAAAGPTLPSAMPPIEPGQYSLKDVSRHAARQAERALILRMLQHTRWNRKEAAEILGISYKALLYKIKENGLDRAS